MQVSRAFWMIRVWRPLCENYCLQHIWHPASGILESGNCPNSHDPWCCACQKFIAERVSAQAQTGDSCLKKPVYVGSWATRRNMFTQRQNLLSVLLSLTGLVWCHRSASAHGVSIENPRSVSDGPKQHLCVWRQTN